MPLRARVQSVADPFIMGEVLRPDSSFNNAGNRDINAKTVRAGGLTINPAIRNLVLITAGQSNYEAVAPSAYTPVNGGALDNINPYNGQMYVAADPLLSCTLALPSPYGPGGVSLRVADLLITNGKFDRVIIVPIAIGGTVVAMWGTGGALSNRIPAAMARLASRGIVPGMSGVTFAFLWGQGESDAATGTAPYVASINQVLASLFATGFNGRAWINLQTMLSGVTSATTRAAQSSGSVITGNVFQGADADSLNTTFRQADQTHFLDTGMASLATLIYNAMHATGAPY